MSRWRCRIAFIALSAIIGIQGCTRVWKIQDVPPLRGGSPLSAAPSVTFAIRDFKDARPKQLQEEFITDPVPMRIVERALEKELVRNGHTFSRKRMSQMPM